MQRDATGSSLVHNIAMKSMKAPRAREKPGVSREASDAE